MTTIILAIAALVAAQEPAQSTRLVCMGATNTISMAMTNGRVTGDAGGGANISAQHFSRGSGGGTVLVDITETSGRINIPRSLVPALAKRGQDGWYDFDEVERDADTIRGRFTLSPINKPRVTIDRRTGAIRVKVQAQGFEGVCQKAQAEALF